VAVGRRCPADRQRPGLHRRLERPPAGARTGSRFRVPVQARPDDAAALLAQASPDSGSNCSFSTRCKRQYSTKTATPTARELANSKPAGLRRCRKRSPGRIRRCASKHRPLTRRWSGRAPQRAVAAVAPPAAAGSDRAGTGQDHEMTHNDPSLPPRRLAAHPVAARTAGCAPAAGAHLRRRGIVARSELDYEFSSLLPPAQLTHAADAAVLLADAIAGQPESSSSPTTTATAPPPARSASGHCAPSAPRSIIWCRTASPTATACRPTSSTSRRRRSPNLIVTVDNGIASVDGVARARRARHRHADHRPPPAGRRTAGRRLHRQPQSSRLRLSRASIWPASA
jgi:hypothetical protein